MFGDGATVKKIPLIGVHEPITAMGIVYCMGRHIEKGGKKDAK
jgi:hypothetical protein